MIRSHSLLGKQRPREAGRPILSHSRQLCPPWTSKKQRTLGPPGLALLAGHLEAMRMDWGLPAAGFCSVLPCTLRKVK